MPLATVSPTGRTSQLVLSPSNPQIAQGTVQQFTLRRLQPDGHIVDLTAQGTWSVRAADGTLLSSAAEGMIELATPGRYRVSAEYDGRRIQTDVTVTAATLSSIAISPLLPQVAKGLTEQFRATGTYSDGSTQDITTSAAWSIRDTVGTGVAVINSLGLVRTKEVGKALITARVSTRSASTTIEVTAAALKTLSLSPNDATVAKGTSQQFSALGAFTDGTVQDVTTAAAWAVRDVVGSGVASIDGTGTAVGESVGKAQVSAEYLDQIAEATLTVSPPAVRSLSITPTAGSIAKGTTLRFTATALLADGTTQDVSTFAEWKATDVTGSGVASIDASGLAKGNAVGSASINCVHRGFSSTVSLTVTPAVLSVLTLSPAAATVAKGRSQAFTLVGTYGDGTTQDLTAAAVWSISDVVGTNVASLTAGGVAFGKNAGKAQVKAEHSGKSVTSTLTVVSALLTSLAISPGSASVEVGATQQFKAIGSYSDGSAQDVSSSVFWSVSDVAPATGVATITPGGLASGKSKGSATVSASYSGHVASAGLAVGLGVGMCSSSGWCWRNPLPQGRHLVSVWTLDANNAWAISDTGLIFRWNGSDWSQQPNPAKWGLASIWGADSKNIWAVGGSGVIVKWNGSKWTEQRSGYVWNLYGVWGLDANNVWAVGHNGIVKWNGTAWSTQASGLGRMSAIWGTSATNVYAVGESGTVLRWDGTSWSWQRSGTSEELRAIWGADANNIWAVGGRDTVVKWDGITWTSRTAGTTRSLRCVWGSSASSVWVVGEWGAMRRWDGTSWTPQTSGTDRFLNGISGSSAGNTWVVGNNGVMLRWNGTAWSGPPRESFEDIYGLWGTDAKNIWAVGGGGTIRKWNGTAWTFQPTGSPQSFIKVWGTDVNNVWVVGTNGAILKWDGTAWSAQTSGTAKTLHGIWGSDTRNVWAAGDSGTLLKWDGMTWNPTGSGPAIQNLHGIWGSDARNVWAVGTAGTLLKWDGTAWATEASGTTEMLSDVWGTSASNVWITVFDGKVLRLNGGVWSAMATGVNSPRAIWGSDSNNMWAVGYNGSIAKWDGTAWSAQVSGAKEGFNAVWGADAKNVWAGGYAGTLLQNTQ